MHAWRAGMQIAAADRPISGPRLLVSLTVMQPYEVTRLRGYVIQGCNKFENWRFSDPNNNYNNQSELQGFSSSKPLGADYHYSPGVRHLQLC